MISQGEGVIAFGAVDPAEEPRQPRGDRFATGLDGLKVEPFGEFAGQARGDVGAVPRRPAASARRATMSSAWVARPASVASSAMKPARAKGVSRRSPGNAPIVAASHGSRTAASGSQVP
jgi:hypothetical protein